MSEDKNTEEKEEDIAPQRSVFDIPQSATIDKRDDAQFQYEIKNLIKKSETIRLTHMQRHQTQKKIGITLSLLAMLAGATSAGWFLLMDIDITKAIASMVITFAIPLAVKGWMRDPIHAYKHDFKNIYMPELADIMGGFDYHPTRGVNESVLSKTGIMPNYTHYHSEDCFRGHYKGCKVLFSEALLTDKKKKNQFKGIFVLLELPTKIFEGHTILTADRNMAEQYQNNRWRKFTQIPIPVSQKKWDRFVGFTNNPEDAQLILGEKLIKELAEADIAFGDQNMSAVFFRGKYIFLSIPHEKDMFEACDLYLPVSTERHASACKKEIKQLLEIVDIFDLYATQSE